MSETIGDTLPLALGIAFSPLPIIAAILMLFSPRGRGTSVGFLLGWLLGTVVAVVGFTLLAGLLPAEDPAATRPVAGTITIVLGTLLALLALRRWRSRPKPGEQEKLPRWVDATDSMNAGRGLALAFALTVVDPKNLLLAAGAGLGIATASLSAGGTTVAISVFAFVASSSVAIPVLGYLFAVDAARRPLTVLHTWLVHNSTIVLAVLLLVIGVILIEKGIASF